MGKYVGISRGLVPTAEPPVRAFRSALGWLVILTAFLEHSVAEAGLRVRFFDPSGTLRVTGDIMIGLDEAELGNLFGDGTEVFAITTEEEHSYNVSTEVWSLPKLADPKRVLLIRGTIRHFVTGAAGTVPGVWVNRETYDGVHAETKGRVEEFWEWDKEHNSLSLRNK